MLQRWKKRDLGDVIYVRCKQKGAVQSDTEALHLLGQGYGEAIDEDVWGFGVQGFEANEQGLSFAATELQNFHTHPAADVLEAGGKGGGEGGSGGATIVPFPPDGTSSTRLDSISLFWFSIGRI